MLRKSIYTTAIAGLSVCSLFGQQTEKPNLVLFMSDDCSYYDIGCYGSADSKTPNIDNFASEGMLFTKAYQACPMSSPTRHNLMTGLWPVKTGAYPNHTMAKEGTLSIVQHLRPAGYKVALIGKSHVEPSSVFDWDLYVNTLPGGDIDFEAVESFIGQCKSEATPFCLFVMSREPHSPWNKGNPGLFNPEKVKLPPFYVDIPETRKKFCDYLAEINYMDAHFGKLLEILDRKQVRDKSAVVYLSEQGNSFPFAKWTLYDPGVRSACIVRWPGVVKSNIVSDAIVEFVDIVPTFLEMAGAKPRTELDGKSFLGVLTGKETEHKQYTFSLQTTRGIYSGSEYYGIRAVADKKYRYIVNLTPEMTFKNTETEGKLFKRWKDLAENDEFAAWITDRYQHRPAIELYDIENDRYCMKNIAGLSENAPVIARLDNVLRQWMKECGDEGQPTEMKATEHQFRNAKGQIGEIF